MKKFGQKVTRFLKSEDGPTAVEYAVMLALIVVVCLASIQALGQGANDTFSLVGDNMEAARQEAANGGLVGGA